MSVRVSGPHVSRHTVGMLLVPHTPACERLEFCCTTALAVLLCRQALRQVPNLSTEGTTQACACQGNRHARRLWGHWMPYAFR